MSVLNQLALISLFLTFVFTASLAWESGFRAGVKHQRERHERR